MKKLWKWLSGKKTAIGGLLILAAQQGGQLWPDQWKLWEMLVYAANTFLLTGLGHKTLKGIPDKHLPKSLRTGDGSATEEEK